LAKVKVSFGEPIEFGKVALDEKDDEFIYEKVTAVLKERIQGCSMTRGTTNLIS